MMQPKQKRKIKITTNSDLDIQIESIVNIPREYVYQAHTDPKAIPQWWGPAKYTTSVVEMDVRSGGRWRYIQRDSEGQEHVFFGEYREIVPIDRITWTFNYEPFPDSESVETIQFIALDENRTKIIVNSIFPSKETRDAMLQSGMESGYSESLDRLEKMNFSSYESQKMKFCLWFDNQAEEAVKFYVTLLENSKITNINRYGPNQHMPEGTVMTISFILAGQQMMAINGGPTYKLTPAFSIYVNCENQDEVDRLWNTLVNGGEESQCGWLVDKFGVSWQIVPKKFNQFLKSGTKEQIKRVMTVLMPMKKIQLDILEQAYESVMK